MDGVKPMSTNSPSLWPTPGRPSPSRIVDAVGGVVAAIVGHVRPLLQATAFWSAVAMPFLYVPLLLGGLEGGEFTAFLALVAANALVLVVGHGHDAGGERESGTASR
jgi:hypothetical protein